MKYLITILIILYCSFAFAKSQLIYFEPEIIELKGEIRILKFPGPPGYESIKNGDTNETGPYLILSEPINVEATANDEINETAKNIKLIQLIFLDDYDWSKLEDGNIVKVVGKMFSAQTGHHHARVLLKATKINVISNHKNSSNELNITAEDHEFFKHQHLQS